MLGLIEIFTWVPDHTSLTCCRAISAEAMASKPSVRKGLLKAWGKCKLVIPFDQFMDQSFPNKCPCQDFYDSYMANGFRESRFLDIAKKEGFPTNRIERCLSTGQVPCLVRLSIVFVTSGVHRSSLVPWPPCPISWPRNAMMTAGATAWVLLRWDHEERNERRDRTAGMFVSYPICFLFPGNCKFMVVAF